MKYIKVILVNIIFFIALMLLNNNSYAANSQITVSNSNPKVGDVITVTISGNAASWNVNLTSSGPATANSTTSFSNATESGENENITIGRVNYTVTGPGTISFSLSGQLVNGDYSSVDATGSASVKATAVQQSTPKPTPTPTPTPKPTPKPTPTPVTLTFSNASGTMYTTGSVRFRSHYDTSNSKNIIKTLDKGTEVTITGKAKGWYKVTYGGKTGYVSADYLTSTKPAEPTPEPSTPPSTAPEEQKTKDSSLKSLSIAGIEITPAFDATIFNYEANTVDTEITSVEVLAEVNNEKAKYEVIGNTDLKDGENIIAVAVTAEDGTVSKYEIKLIKGIIETATPEQTPVATPSTNQNSLSKKQIAIIAGIAGVTLLAIILLVRHYRKQNDIDYAEPDYSFLKNDEEIQNKEKDKKQEFLDGFENNDNNNDDEKRKGGKHF